MGTTSVKAAISGLLQHPRILLILFRVPVSPQRDCVWLWKALRMSKVEGYLWFVLLPRMDAWAKELCCISCKHATWLFLSNRVVKGGKEEKEGRKEEKGWKKVRNNPSTRCMHPTSTDKAEQDIIRGGISGLSRNRWWDRAIHRQDLSSSPELKKKRIDIYIHRHTKKQCWTY